jgi:hypothetical protein
MAKSVGAHRAPLNGPSRSRRQLPWEPSSAPDDAFERLGLERSSESSVLSAKAIAVQNRHEPLRALVSSLLPSEETEVMVGLAGNGTLSLDGVASRFVRRRGTEAWQTMREVLRRVVVGRQAGRDYRRAVLDLATSSAFPNPPLDADELSRGPDGRMHPGQRGLAKRNPEAAAILVARATGRCPKIIPPDVLRGRPASICWAKIPDYRRGATYCLDHSPCPEHEHRADRNAVSTLLRGAADALRV